MKVLEHGIRHFLVGSIRRNHERLEACLGRRRRMARPRLEGRGEAGDAEDGKGYVVQQSQVHMDSLDPGMHARQDITLALLTLAVVLAGCSRTQTAHSAGPPAEPVMPVTVARVVRKTVPVEV